MRLKRRNRMDNQKSTKFRFWCELCDADLTGDTGVCSNCGCKAKKMYTKRLKNTNFDENLELNSD